MISRRTHRIPLAILAGALAAGCVDRESPLLPSSNNDDGGQPSRDLVQVRCEVSLSEKTLACAPVESSGDSGPLFDRIVGAQDMYVKLASSGTTYDGGTEVLQSNVTLQNLLAQNMGTTDGVTVEGAYVFFVQGPEVTSGSGSATIINADGTGTFTASDQPYFHFDQVLTPYQVSTPKTWLFDVDPTVDGFSFLVYVSAPLQDESSMLDIVWEGTVDSDWGTADNWMSSIMPDSTSAVSIFRSSMLSGSMPVLSTADTVLHLRVGSGSSMDLGANELVTRGNVDATGTIENGSLEMSGAGALLQGTVDAIEISGSTSLQGSTTATGALSITGSLNTDGQPLNIAIP